jgi:hypothetical protein
MNLSGAMVNIADSMNCKWPTSRVIAKGETTVLICFSLYILLKRSGQSSTNDIKYTIQK